MTETNDQIRLTSLGATYLALYDAAKAGKLPGGLEGVDRIMAILEPELKGWDERIRQSQLQEVREQLSFRAVGTLGLDKAYDVEHEGRRWVLRKECPFGLEAHGERAFLCLELLGGEDE